MRAMQPFDFQPSTRVIFGENTLVQLGALTKELGGTRVLVVSDPGVVSAGIVENALHSLRKESLAVSVFDGVEENPTTLHVESGVEVCGNPGANRSDNRYRRRQCDGLRQRDQLLAH